MTEYLGIIFALIALVSWGVGDFFIQRSARKFGDWESIFAIEITGLVVLLPFVFRDLGGILNLSGREILILLAVGLAFIDRKSTRLNSSHSSISYSVFC